MKSQTMLHFVVLSLVLAHSAFLAPTGPTVTFQRGAVVHEPSGMPETPQLACEGEWCFLYNLERITCVHTGHNVVTDLPEWECAMFPGPLAQIASIEVLCEHTIRNEPVMATGWCSLKYTPILVPLVEMGGVVLCYLGLWLFHAVVATLVYTFLGLAIMSPFILTAFLMSYLS